MPLQSQYIIGKLIIQLSEFAVLCKVCYGNFRILVASMSQQFCEKYIALHAANIHVVLAAAVADFYSEREAIAEKILPPLCMCERGGSKSTADILAEYWFQKQKENCIKSNKIALK